MNRQKRKGTDFERQLVELLNEKLLDAQFKRVPSSGSMGTNMHEPLLTGDINGDIIGFPQKIKAECKVGYSRNTDAETKSLTVEKKWLDKILEEAKSDYRMPLLFSKFSNVREGIRVFVSMDLGTFIDLANHITKMKKELDKIHDKLDSIEKLSN